MPVCPKCQHAFLWQVHRDYYRFRCQACQTDFVLVEEVELEKIKAAAEKADKRLEAPRGVRIHPNTLPLGDRDARLRRPEGEG